MTAAACKSLSLTQALAAHCQEIDANDSSEEDIDITVPMHNQVTYFYLKTDHKMQPFIK